MGKGMGCVPSKLRKQSRQGESPQPGVVDDDSSSSSSDVPVVVQPINISSNPKEDSSILKVYVIYYSMYGHVKALAKKAVEGINSVDGVEGHLFQVPETLTPEILQKMGAPPKDESVPIISAHEMPYADGFLFGFPTRFGAMAAQMKAFFDSTGSLWKEQKLAGKPAGIFVSTGSQGGGQETTPLTSITQLVHHGMLFVPIGYTFGGSMFTMDEVHGGSPYGAGTYAGDGSRMPNQTELELAEHQGKYTAGVVKKLRGGS